MELGTVSLVMMNITVTSLIARGFLSVQNALKRNVSM